MTNYLGKSCSFNKSCLCFVNFCQFYVFFPFRFDGGLWDLIALIADHWLSPYFA